MLSKPAHLYLIPTPLVPPTPEAILQSLPAVVISRISSLTCFYVENAKSARAFLQSVNTLSPLAAPIQQLNLQEFNKDTPSDAIATLLAPLKKGLAVGLLSEAGAPAIADPGAPLIAAAHVAGIPVEPLIGPCAIMLALMASGQNGQSFAFNGYLPISDAACISALKRFESRAHAERQSQIFIETPFRNESLLKKIIQHCNEKTLLTIAAQLTDPKEFVMTRSIKEWALAPLPTLHKIPCIFIFGKPA